MATSTSVVSQTLRAITATKVSELEKRRISYRKRKTSILSSEAKCVDERERLLCLIKGLQDFPGLEGCDIDRDFFYAQKWLDQSLYDASVSDDRLAQLALKLESHLDKNGRKLDLAHLYSRLLTEWIDAPAALTEPESDEAERKNDDSFEVLQSSQKERLEQLRDKFAQVVFEPFETDEVEIDNYLRSLFAVDEHGEQYLRQLRRDVHAQGSYMLRDHFRLDDQGLRWCVKALLKNGLLNDAKKASLNEFLKDDAVLGEIKDVLNMRFRDLETWDWDRAHGMPVEPRQSLNGKWRVYMDDDVLDAILTHWIGTSWAVWFKRVFRDQGLKLGLLSRKSRDLCEKDRAKVKYYLIPAAHSEHSSVQADRVDKYEQNFFLSPLPDKFFEEAGGYDEDEQATDEQSDKKSPTEIKQLLLRTIASEALVRQCFDGEVAVLQSDFQWFCAGFPLSTIFAVLRFLDVPEQWVTFFKKALTPPMDMLDGEGVRTRRRGLPMAHIFEKLFGEMVLFFLDIAVVQNSGMLLYRYHDDLYLAGQPDKVASSWEVMATFAKVMGLEFNVSKTGSVYLTNDDRAKNPSIAKILPSGLVNMNFLELDAQYGDWTINKEHVDQHVRQLKKQLDGSKSILQWIKTYNSCMSRFFKYTFGEPANCFGLKHLNAILKTHRDIQKLLFDGDGNGTTVVAHLKNRISNNFSVPLVDIPDSWLCAPESLGGLGLKNPFPSLLLLRHDTREEPREIMKKYLKTEAEDYSFEKRAFDSQPERERRKHYNSVFGDLDNPALSWSDAQTFLSFEDYQRFRESTSVSLERIYTCLQARPEAEPLRASPRLSDLSDKLEKVDGETMWTLLFYEDEMFEKFGGLDIVNRTLLPLGVLKALKEGSVTWQMAL